MSQEQVYMCIRKSCQTDTDADQTYHTTHIQNVMRWLKNGDKVYTFPQLKEVTGIDIKPLIQEQQ